jgi:hypothetical protein
MVVDVLERGDLAFPRSLPEFQRLFPDDARAPLTLSAHDGATGSSALVAERLAIPIVLPIAQLFCDVATASTIATSRLAPSWNVRTHPLSVWFWAAYLNAFRSLLGIAGDVTAPTYAELYAKKITSHYG